MNLAGAGTSLRQNIKDLTGRDVYVAEYEEIKKSDRVNSAGRASYVERNQWMIDDSDFCIFFIEREVGGSALAYDYAQKYKQAIIFKLE